MEQNDTIRLFEDKRIRTARDILADDRIDEDQNDRFDGEYIVTIQGRPC